jgi:threonyl-tRNA synthetase
MEKIPYMLVIGDKEMENRQVAVRSRKDGDLGVMSFDDFIVKLTDEIAEKVSWA